MVPELEPLTAVLVSWAVAAVLMTALWLRSVRTTKDAGIVDVGWAGGLALLAVFHALVASGDPARRTLVAVLGAVWGLRLAAHLVRRGRGKPEDPRYAELRRSWGGRADALFFPVFQAQALLDVVLALSFLVVAQNPRAGLGWPEAVGATIWIVAVGGEWIADRQLTRFRAVPANRGRTCREGLWRWSRHPNYFFEWVHWLAYVPLAHGSPWWMVTLVAPALMYVFVTRITGIPPTERQSLRSRGDDYRDYQRTTNAFFPGPNRTISRKEPVS